MKDVIVIDFHCLLKGVDCTDNIEHFSLDNLERHDIDEKITDFIDNFRVIVYHPKAGNQDIRNKIFDFLIDRLVKFAFITDEMPKSSEIHRVYNLVKVKESIFLLREIEKGTMV